MPSQPLLETSLSEQDRQYGVPHLHGEHHTNETQDTDAEIMTDREVLLQMLLNEDEYKEAKEGGLDQLFHHDDESGKDSLRHILCGELSGDQRIPKGFHHVPSANKMSLEDGYGNLLTRIERVVDSAGNEIERPSGLPYSAEVVVDGKEKETLRRSKTRRAETELVRSISTMFPDEMSPLEIMKSINTAIHNADPAHDKVAKIPNGRAYYNLVGTVPLDEGNYNMGVCVSMDLETMTVVTAFPSMRHSGTIPRTEGLIAPSQPEVASAAGGIALGGKGAHHG
jgi:hypothetical protein